MQWAAELSWAYLCPYKTKIAKLLPMDVPRLTYLPYVYCLIAPAATWRAFFLSHMTSCLLPIVLRSRVYFLPSALFCHMSALFWIHQLCNRTHDMTTVVAPSPFYGKSRCHDDITDFGHVLTFKFWELRLSKFNLWRQMTNSSDHYAAGLVFTSFDDRLFFYFVWNVKFNNLSRMSKIWCPKAGVINSSTSTWDLGT